MYVPVALERIVSVFYTNALCIECSPCNVLVTYFGGSVLCHGGDAFFFVLPALPTFEVILRLLLLFALFVPVGDIVVVLLPL